MNDYDIRFLACGFLFGFIWGYLCYLDYCISKIAKRLDLNLDISFRQFLCEIFKMKR